MSNSSQGLPLLLNMGCSGVSACVAEFHLIMQTLTLPIDTAKVRLQVLGEGVSGGARKGMLRTLVDLAREEGPRKLYKGLSPALQRQMAFASVRLAIYEPIRQVVCGREFHGDPPLLKKILSGLLSGGIGITLACPTDIVKIRFQANRGLYRSTWEAYTAIVRSQGVLGLWQGYLSNVVRNSVIAAAELAGYDQAKQVLLESGLFADNSLTHVCSATCAGFLATCVGSPFDVVKTRYMNSRPGTYTGALGCARVCLQSEGFLGFYKGFLPNFYRIALFNISLWVVLEKVRKYTKLAYHHRRDPHA